MLDHVGWLHSKVIHKRMLVTQRGFAFLLLKPLQ